MLKKDRAQNEALWHAVNNDILNQKYFCPLHWTQGTITQKSVDKKLEIDYERCKLRLLVDRITVPLHFYER